MIRCDIQFLEDNYVLLVNGNDITTNFIECVRNKNITKVVIKDNELCYDCEPFKPMFVDVFTKENIYIDKIVVFDKYKHDHVEQFRETYNRLFKKEHIFTNIVIDKKIKLWEKVYLILIENFLIYLKNSKKIVVNLLLRLKKDLNLMKKK